MNNNIFMGFIQIWFQALLVIMSMMTILWIVSVAIKNVSIADIFWGSGFVLTSVFYFLSTEGYETRKWILLVLVSIWGLRLSIYLAWRNIGKGEERYLIQVSGAIHAILIILGIRQSGEGMV